MIDPPSGPGEFILSEDGKSWLPVTPDPAPTPAPEESTDGLQRSDRLREGRGDKRNS